MEEHTHRKHMELRGLICEVSGCAGLKHNANTPTVIHEVGMDSRHFQAFIQMGSVPLNR